MIWPVRWSSELETVLLFWSNKETDIDRPLASYYPDMEQTEVTIRQLLTHTSGLDPFIPTMTWMLRA